MGWHFTKVSKLENGSRSPSEEDIRTWCSACGAVDQIPDLIATVRHIEAMYHEYRRQMQAGMKHLTESAVPLYEQTALFRIYDNTVIPGLFTTAGTPNVWMIPRWRRTFACTASNQPTYSSGGIGLNSDCSPYLRLSA